MARHTAMWHLSTLDGAGRILDTRPFIGTAEEAFDELKAEYQEFFPTGVFIKGLMENPNHRGDHFWNHRKFELSHGNSKEGYSHVSRVTGQDKTMGIYRIFEMRRTSPMKEEAE